MFEFTLPDLGEGVAEGEVLEWHVAPGDRVAEDDVLAEVETDKAAVDVPSPVDGVVQELHHHPGDVVRVGEVLVTIEPDDGAEGADDAAVDAAVAAVDEGEAADAGASSEGGSEGPSETDAGAPPGTDQRTFAPPHVRRLARELGVDLPAVAGSGPGGRITEDDVREAARRAEESAEASGDRGTDAATDASAEGTTDVSADAATDDGRELKSAVRRVGNGRTAAAESESESDGDEGPTSVVRRVGSAAGSDDGATDADDESAASTGEADAAAAGGESAGPSGTGSDEPTATGSDRPAAAGSEGADREEPLAAPATRRLARDLGVDLADVPPDEARDGEPFVTPDAVRAYAAESGEAAAGAESAADAEAPTEAAPRPEPSSGERPTRREPYRGVRRRIGEQMQRSRSEVPHATHHDLADVRGLVDAKERLEPLAEDRGVDLTYLPFVLKAVAAALAEHPVLNTELDAEAEEVVYKEYYDLGVATATEAGLMVPVVRDVDRKGIVRLSGEVNDLVARARDRSIEREELQGSTFTVTNFGAIGGEYADPVINVPETAILGTGALKERPVVEDGEVVARPTLPLSLAIDHRVIDGADAARFVETLKEYLADPRLLLLD